jgi:hypothetical protein
VLLMAALVATTSDGPAWLDVNTPPRLEAPDRPRSDEPGSRDDPVGGDSPVVVDSAQDSGSGPTSFTRVITIVILVLALTIGGVAVAAGLRAVIRRRTIDATTRRGVTRESEPESDADPPDALVHEVTRGLRSASEGSPRNAIVATWISLEEATVAAGFEPHIWETPAEFVQRALTTYAVDEQDIGRLADLYREARFSVHRITEAHRDEAIGCLRRLCTQLTRVDAR